MIHLCTLFEEDGKTRIGKTTVSAPKPPKLLRWQSRLFTLAFLRASGNLYFERTPIDITSLRPFPTR